MVSEQMKKKVGGSGMSKELLDGSAEGSEDELTETEELIAMLGRMKYLNRTQDEIYNPVPLMKKLNVTWDDIKEIKC